MFILVQLGKLGGCGSWAGGWQRIWVKGRLKAEMETGKDINP